MKTRTYLSLFAVLCGAAAGLRAAPPAVSPPIAPTATPNPAASSSSPVEGYRRWRKVNSTPEMVSATFTTLCRTMTPQEIAEARARGEFDPHLDNTPKVAGDRVRFITVYANKIAEAPMMHKSEPKFPEGSIIVKEKLKTATSTTPELLTVMRKQHKGYNPSSGDWEYLVFDGSGKTIQAQGKLQSCQSCHDAAYLSDHVYRNYLDADTRWHLK